MAVAARALPERGLLLSRLGLHSYAAANEQPNEPRMLRPLLAPADTGAPAVEHAGELALLIPMKRPLPSKAVVPIRLDAGCRG